MPAKKKQAKAERRVQREEVRRTNKKTVSKWGKPKIKPGLSKPKVLKFRDK